MLRNAFSQPENSSIFLRNALAPLPHPSTSTPPPALKQPTLSRAASDLLASGISASTLLSAAYESLSLLHTAIQDTSAQRQNLRDTHHHHQQQRKQGSRTINRAASFSRPRSVGSGGDAIGREVKEVQEQELYELRLERMGGQEGGLRGDIDLLKRYTEQETLGGKHHRGSSFEMQGDEVVEEKENTEDDKRGLDDDETIPEKVARGAGFAVRVGALNIKA